MAIKNAVGVMLVALLAGSSVRAAVEEPAFIAEKAVLWLDAADRSTLLTDEANAVTNWISRDSTHRRAYTNVSATVGTKAPVYNEKDYGRKCVDFGATGSARDLRYKSLKYKTVFMCVAIEQSINAFLLGNTSNDIYLHRGNNGAWWYSESNSCFTDAWQDGFKVSSTLSSTLIPGKSFLVLAIRMNKESASDSLTQDRTFTGRTGGRQLSELILFNEYLSNDDIATVSQYLLDKWEIIPKGVPALIARRSSLWLDASDITTLKTNDLGQVTNWVSRSPGGLAATVYSGYTGPQYEPTKFGQVCLDFGSTTGNMVDMRYSKTPYYTAFFCVKIMQSVNAFLIGNTATADLHRGSNGEWKYQSGSSNLQDAWQDGQTVTGLTATKIPDDDFYVLGVRTSKQNTTDSLTQDRTYGTLRSGGRQLSEVIVYPWSLSDEEVNTVNQYLLRKWKLKPNVTVTAVPDERGEVEPAYGVYEDLALGRKYTFTAPTGLTNDSHTLSSTLTGWSITKTDFTTETGTGNETSFEYNDETSYATLTWKWTDWVRMPYTLGEWLPNGYRSVQYIEQVKEGYIDTGIKLSAKTTDIVFTVGSANADALLGDTAWVGNRCNGKNGFALRRIKNDWRLVDYNGNLFEKIGIYSTTLGPLTVAITNGKWFFMDPDSTDKYKTHSAGVLNGTAADSNLHLFMCDPTVYQPQKYIPPAGARIYQLEVYEEGACVHKLVACIRKRDRRPGFYDLVTGTFLTNTKGELKAGPYDLHHTTPFMMTVPQFVI